MYNTSQTWKQKIYTNVQSTLKVYIDYEDEEDDDEDNYTLIDPKYIFDFKKGGNIFDEALELGATPSQYIEFKIHKNVVTKKPVKVRVEYGILVGEDTFEIIPIGIYNVEDFKNNNDSTYTIKAIDNMILFDADNGYYDGSSLISEGATLFEILEDICEKKGVVLGSESFLNSNQEMFVYDNEIKAREYISYIAECAGGFACIGRDGKLYIKNFCEDEAEVSLNLFGDYNWGDSNNISRVAYENGTETFKFGDDSGNSIWLKQENIFITNLDMVETIYDELKDFSVYGFSGKTIIDPAIDIGDQIEIDEKPIIYQGELSFGKRTIANINSNIKIKQKEDTTIRTSQKDINKRVQSRIDEANGKIVRLVEESTEQNQRLTQVEENYEGVVTTISRMEDDNQTQTEMINQISESVNGWEQKITQNGGNNIFYYAKEFWTGSTEEDEADLEEYTDTEIQQRSVSGIGYLLKSGTSKQSLKVKNGVYAISYTYQKSNSLAEGYVLINGEQYDLTEDTWTEELIIVNVDTNTIDFEMHSDTDDAFFIFDLMGSLGSEKQVWTQNPNETRTETVTIGKGIQVESNATNTYTRIDSDGNRVFNKTTGQVVSEQTDKGTWTKQITANEGSIGGILIQQQESQTWISSLL